MKTLSILFLIALTGCGEKPAPEVKAPLRTADQIIETTGCLSCHQVGNQLKLPNWQEVADRYKDNLEAEPILISKISNGGAGSWGKMDMPPYRDNLNPEELRIVVKKILATPTNRHGNKAAPEDAQTRSIRTNQ